MGFNSGFKGLNKHACSTVQHHSAYNWTNRNRWDTQELVTAADTWYTTTQWYSN